MDLKRTFGELLLRFLNPPPLKIASFTDSVDSSNMLNKLGEEFWPWKGHCIREGQGSWCVMESEVTEVAVIKLNDIERL